MVSPQTSHLPSEIRPATLLSTTLKAVFSTPITVMVIYTVISLLLEENYPFSHYPMYSNPGADRSYYIVADGDGKPIPIAELTGVTCPKIGKMYRSKSAKMGKLHHISKNSLSAEQQQEVGEEIFAQLRNYAVKLKKTMPARLMLQKVDVNYVGGNVMETPETLAKE